MAYEYQEYPKYLYHPIEAPQGKVFNNAAETEGLSRRGWVDSPAKFPMPGRGLAPFKAWWSQWEWLVKVLALLLGVIATVAKLLGLL